MAGAGWASAGVYQRLGLRIRMRYGRSTAQMYCEVHGSGGNPLLLLHSGLFNIDLQFSELLPSLAASRQGLPPTDK